MTEHKTELQRARIIAIAISPWLYSVGPIPEALNRLWLNWLEENRVATMAEIKAALRESKRG